MSSGKEVFGKQARELVRQKVAAPLSAGDQSGDGLDVSFSVLAPEA